MTPNPFPIIFPACAPPSSPHSRHADLRHLKSAYAILAPEGRLATITSPGCSTQCCFATHMSNTVQIEVQDDEDLEAALNRATEEANFDNGWKKLDYEGPIFIVAACYGASSDPGASAERIEVPHILTERGQMQIDIPSDQGDSKKRRFGW